MNNGVFNFPMVDHVIASLSGRIRRVNIFLAILAALTMWKGLLLDRQDSVWQSRIEMIEANHGGHIASLHAKIAELEADKSAEIQQLQNIVLGHEKRLDPETFPEPNEPESCK